MSRRSHAGAWLALSLVAWLVGPVLGTDDTLTARLHAELAATTAALGERLSRSLPEGPGSSDGDVRLVSPPRAWQGLGRIGAATPAHRAARRAVDWTAGYARSLEVQTRLAVLRLASAAWWCALLWPVALAACVDGLVVRAVKGRTFGFQNPAAFAVANHGLVAALFAPATLAVLPLTLPAAWPVVWLLVVLLPLRTTLVHLPTVFTR